MSLSLTLGEQRFFEDLFDMSGGYVLDLTNNTFESLFRREVRLNIYDPKYAVYGNSKAKRLRAFWEIEPGQIVGKILSALLELWWYSIKQKTDKESVKKDGEKIIGRLLGKEIKNEISEDEFLVREYKNVSIEKLKIDYALIPILRNRLNEAQDCLKVGASLSVIFLCGSILEGALLGVATQKPEEFNKSSCSPKTKDNKVKRFHEWTLAEFIDVSYDIGIVKLDVKRFGHSLRDFRNYIHPYQQILTNFSPTQHTAKICLQVLKAAIADLSGER